VVALVTGQELQCTCPQLGVEYGSTQIHCSTTQTPAQTSSQPAVTFSPVNNGAGYAVVMIDPDAPNAITPTSAPIRHWVQVNVPAQDFATGKITGQALGAYAGPAPPSGSGYHRYYQFLYLQPSPNVNYAPLPTSRANWDYKGWAASYNLTFVASNFFMALNP